MLLLGGLYSSLSATVIVLLHSSGGFNCEDSSAQTCKDDATLDFMSAAKRMPVHSARFTGWVMYVPQYVATSHGLKGCAAFVALVLLLGITAWRKSSKVYLLMMLWNQPGAQPTTDPATQSDMSQNNTPAQHHQHAAYASSDATVAEVVGRACVIGGGNKARYRRRFQTRVLSVKIQNDDAFEHRHTIQAAIIGEVKSYYNVHSACPPDIFAAAWQGCLQMIFHVTDFFTSMDPVPALPAEDVMHTMMSAISDGCKESAVLIHSNTDGILLTKSEGADSSIQQSTTASHNQQGQPLNLLSSELAPPQHLLRMDPICIVAGSVQPSVVDLVVPDAVITASCSFPVAVNICFTRNNSTEVMQLVTLQQTLRFSLPADLDVGPISIYITSTQSGHAGILLGHCLTMSLPQAAAQELCSAYREGAEQVLVQSSLLDLLNDFPVIWDIHVKWVVDGEWASWSEVSCFIALLREFLDFCHNQGLMHCYAMVMHLFPAEFWGKVLEGRQEEVLEEFASRSGSSTPGAGSPRQRLENASAEHIAHGGTNTLAAISNTGIEPANAVASTRSGASVGIGPAVNAVGTSGAHAPAVETYGADAPDVAADTHAATFSVNAATFPVNVASSSMNGASSTDSGLIPQNGTHPSIPLYSTLRHVLFGFPDRGTEKQYMQYRTCGTTLAADKMAAGWYCLLVLALLKSPWVLRGKQFRVGGDVMCLAVHLLLMSSFRSKLWRYRDALICVSRAAADAVIVVAGCSGWLLVDPVSLTAMANCFYDIFFAIAFTVPQQVRVTRWLPLAALMQSLHIIQTFTAVVPLRLIIVRCCVSYGIVFVAIVAAMDWWTREVFLKQQQQQQALKSKKVDKTE